MGSEGTERGVKGPEKIEGRLQGALLGTELGLRCLNGTATADKIFEMSEQGADGGDVFEKNSRLDYWFGEGMVFKGKAIIF